MSSLEIAYFLTHPIQYQAPMMRYLVKRELPLRVYYACDPQKEGLIDPKFGLDIRWDVSLTEGCPHEVLSLTSELPLQSFARFQELSHRATQALRRNPNRAAWIHGWGNAYPRTPYFALAAFRAARKLRLPILLRGETHCGCLQGGKLHRLVHRLMLTVLFKYVSAFLAVGSANAAFYRAHGVPERKIFAVPYSVDNNFFQARCQEATPQQENIRRSLNLRAGSAVVLFCGRLAPEKQPILLLDAFARLQERRLTEIPPSLLFVGDGPLRSEVEQWSTQCLPGTVKLAGFRNQTELPAFYDLCDVFVLPSSFEPWGLVVNEAMNAGKPVVVSDRVGAGEDLVINSVNGMRFPSGNAGALADALAELVVNGSRRLLAGKASLERINQWGFDQDFRGLESALASLPPAKV